MCEPTTLAAVASWMGASASTAATIGTVGSMATVGLGAVSAYSQASAAKATAKNNARVVEMHAQDAETRGDKQAQEALRRGADIKSSQRAAMAARGLDLGEGTALDLQNQTDFFAQSDAATARNNARKEAWSARSQKAGYQMEAAASQPWLAAGSTLLTQGSQVASRWYK